MEGLGECRFIAIMAPAALSLEAKLKAPRMQQPSTPHEAWFQKHYLHRIQEIIRTLQSPSSRVLLKLELATAPLKSLVKLIGVSLRFALHILLHKHFNRLRRRPKL